VDGAGDSGTPHWIGGLYDARLRCSAGLWKFAYINLDVRMVTPYHQGWVEAPKVAL